MIYLVDANVLSEVTKPQPDDAVVEWLRFHEADLAVDPIILGEIRYGILQLPKGKRRRALEAWFEQGVLTLVCLPWDLHTGLVWASLLARLKVKGLSMPIKDSMVAATALTHELVLATRNARDFQKAGVELVDPFTVS